MLMVLVLDGARPPAREGYVSDFERGLLGEAPIDFC